MQKLDIKDLGVIDYNEALELQMELLRKRQLGEIDNTVLIVEHPEVITFGAREDKNKLVVSDSDDVEVVSIGRGGGATAHNPGQLVFYPIINIRSVNLSVNEYVRTLEAIGIDLLKEYNIVSDRRKGFPGLWIDRVKIASIGVQLKKWVSYHGMAINFNNDLSIFNKIVPCGLDGVKMTSVKEQLGNDVDFEQVKRTLIGILKQYFCVNE